MSRHAGVCLVLHSDEKHEKQNEEILLPAILPFPPKQQNFNSTERKETNQNTTIPTTLCLSDFDTPLREDKQQKESNLTYLPTHSSP